MNTSEIKKEDRLPRIVCVFAAFFTIAIPSFAICVGRGTHNVWVDLAARVEAGSGSARPFALTFLDYNPVFLWALFAAALVLTVSVLMLLRKNSSAGTLFGAGRIVFALGLSSMLSVFYLAMLNISAVLLLLPIFTK